MAYTTVNFKTKKQLKEAVARRQAYLLAQKTMQGTAAVQNGTVPQASPVTVYQPGQGSVPDNGEICGEGPHYPQPHSWYAVATLKNGEIVKVR